ncbi:MAG: DGQHR domain-containing protein, partial [Nitrososphaera sp.]
MLRPGPGANKFEKEVFELFEKFHMKGYIEELAGGPRNKLDIAEQVDVSFRLLTDSAEYFFIVECKDPEDPENLKLKSSVEQLKVRYDLVEKITKPRNFPAGTIIPVLAVNVSPDEIRTTGAIELLMNPRPYPITRDHIDYYKQLMNSYGEEYTFPLFLYEIFQIRLNYGEPLSIPALKTERFGKTLYTFQMPAAILLKIAYVHRATSTNIPNQAYQRMLDPARLRNIAEKLKQNSFETNFPNNIIVSADSSDCTFTPNEGSADVGILKLRNRYASLRVVDGQHRLYSFLYVDGLRDQFQLVVSALEGLSQEEQSVVFASVNYYSKRVTPDLIDYLFSLESRRGKIGRA